MDKYRDKLKFYVLRYDWNNNKVIRYNIFDNVRVYEETIKTIKRYDNNEMSFDDFVEELKGIVAWQEAYRREYEVSIGDAFEENVNKLEKWDCYMQFELNARMFAEWLIK